MANGTPKPLSLVKGHRTKAEKAVRKVAEESMLSGCRMQESEQVRDIPAAHKQFKRMKSIYDKLVKNDAVYEASINRYCLIFAEALMFEKRLEKLTTTFETAVDNVDMEPDKIMSMTLQFAQAVGKLESNLMARRKMLLDIEKESALTLASALRSIPKKPEATKEATGIEAFLKKRGNSQ